MPRMRHFSGNDIIKVWDEQGMNTCRDYVRYVTIIAYLRVQYEIYLSSDFSFNIARARSASAILKLKSRDK